MDQNYPVEINNYLNGETVDFAVQAKHDVTTKTAIYRIGIGLFFLLSFIVFVYSCFMIYFDNEHSNQEKIRQYLSYIPIFILVPLFIYMGLIRSIYLLNTPGSWFIGTPNRMIIFRNGAVKKSIKWADFSENYRINQGSQYSNLIFFLNPNTIGLSYANDYKNSIQMTKIINAEDISQKILQRIKESKNKLNNIK